MSELTVNNDTLCVNAIRVLSAEAVEAAKSGHPGAPMGIAPMAYVLWKKHLNVNPMNPKWKNRDRFVLSAGHASMLQYSLLHLSGFKLSMDDIRSFRQWGSKTPGHPEYGMTEGVETTTGPLGQGLANGVGMALAEKMLAAKFNKPDCPIVNHNTYVIASDGDLMEGISYEACSLAGHFKLGKLICLYDSNNITIDGSAELSFTENTRGRFESMGWQVLEVENGNDDYDAIDRAITEAKQNTEQPSLIIVRTTIGFGSPNKADSASSHGAPLGADEVEAVKKQLAWTETESFKVPQSVYDDFAQIGDRGAECEESWNVTLSIYKQKYQDLAKEWEAAQSGKDAANLDLESVRFTEGSDAIATRSASGKVLNVLSGKVKSLVSGCADLSGSVMTTIEGSDAYGHGKPCGRNIHYGVREHAMGALANGMALHGGIRPAVGTFLIFSDYMKPSVRLAALMGLPVVYMFSHDSVALGEDGPTHQPVEQIFGLRSIPNLTVLRPADANETVAAWKIAMERTDGPTAIVTSRQKLNVLKSGPSVDDAVSRGAYVFQEASKPESIDLIMIATGAELHLAAEARAELEASGKSVRLVSMPSWELFDEEPESYRNSILPPSVEARISVEAGGALGWEKFTGLKGRIIGLNRFGASAPGPVVAEKLGFNKENIVKTALNLLP